MTLSPARPEPVARRFLPNALVVALRWATTKLTLLVATFVLGLAGALVTPQASRAAEYVMGVPPALDEEMADALFRALRLLKDQLGTGEAVTILALGEDPEVAVRVEVTEEHPARRGRQLNTVVAAFDELLEARLVPSDDAALEAPAINIEVGVEELATQGLASTDPTTRTVCLLLPGDPRSHQGTLTAWSMRDGALFTDSAILASTTESPYGTADKQGLLRGVNAHVLEFGRPWLSELARDRVRRGWAGWFDAQGGSLATFTNSPDVAIER